MNKDKTKGVRLDIDGELNRGHSHELADRINIICSMLDDYVIGHPGTTNEFNEKCQLAQIHLGEAQTIADETDESIFGEDT